MHKNICEFTEISRDMLSLVFSLLLVFETV
jgi:hypothetical protein